jgi:hypothetical protein
MSMSDRLFHNGEDITDMGFCGLPDIEETVSNCPKCNAKRLYEDDTCVVCGYEPPMAEYDDWEEVDQEGEFAEAWDAMQEEYNE